ncbi:MAG: hypothetical protein M0R16_11140 [Bacteroidales bacterium]|jgi:hypothetical protein|nr:hypothetical protein [Bacteroidales bacterium]
MPRKKERMNDILERFKSKSVLKQKVYHNTLQVFNELKVVLKDFSLESQKFLRKNKLFKIPVEYLSKGDYEAELSFAGDTLIFLMHTNVFEFPREHSIMRSPYIKEDETRAYCGIIYVYNFLADSLRFNRENDIGYLVARIFVNKEFHFVVEGKRQMDYLSNTFIEESIDYQTLRQILETAVLYCLDFDLLLQPYDMLKELSVAQIKEYSSNMRMMTGKRLGFRFQADPDEQL